MRHRNKFLEVFAIMFFLSSCGTLDEAGKALRNEKTKTTDEFLIEKKEPLTTPPDLFELPEPTKSKNNNQDREKIKSILNTKENKIKSDKSFSSTEDSILDSIRR
tara:strand:- start:1038 stop:1352 length:315 start_codon:yes stop_codon:yes gene_type:complete